MSRHFCLQPFFSWKLSFFTGKVSKFESRDPCKMHFRDHTFWLQSILFIVDKHYLSREYYGLVIKYIKSYHPNWCIKVGNTPQDCLVGGSYWFFCNQTWQGLSVMFSLKLLLKRNFTSPFYGWASTGKATQPLRRNSLLFTTRFQGLPGTQRMKGWVDLAATQQFWNRDPWIGNPVP